jgi:phage terminase large subunit-like protein
MGPPLKSPTHNNSSLIELLSSLTDEEKLKVISSLSDEEAIAILYDWHIWARPQQLPPEGDWNTWLILAGRGFGKTRTGAEWVRMMAESTPDARIALLAPTAADTRDTMVMGESGLLNIYPPQQRPLYEPSKRKITFYNGAIATLYSADEPERLRGPQHTHLWADELCSYRRPEAWDMAMFGLRLGSHPQAIITTTPKPMPLLKSIMSDPATMVTRGSTFDNAANLASNFIDQIKKKYEGTRLGRQELNAEVLEDVVGALFTRALIKYRTP